MGAPGIASLIFQSTHPLRGATRLCGCAKTCRTNFNPRTPCGVRLVSKVYADWTAHFNPRTPCGVRRQAVQPEAAAGAISIHAPLAGCDSMTTWPTRKAPKFQSTHPLRGATSVQFNDGLPLTISIHAPLAGCDYILRSGEPLPIISIHAPLAGCDPTRSTTTTGTRYFNPRTPCGVRLKEAVNRYLNATISIHAPLAGCD